MKLLTDFEGSPKVLAAGNAACGVFARSLAYCGLHETDGLVPKEWAEQAVAREGQQEIPERLCEVGLWEKADDTGFRITGFTDVNKSRHDMAELRAKRSEAGKKGGESSRSTNGKQAAKQNGSKR